MVDKGYIEPLASDANSSSEDLLEDNKYIEELGRELRNCSQEIEYLRDQLCMRNAETCLMEENLQSVELKLAESVSSNERVTLLSKELVKSDKQYQTLMRELKSKDKELQKYAFHVGQLERSFASLSLDSQCELEGIKLDLMAMEQRCLDAERSCHELDQEKSRMTHLVGELKNQFLEAQLMICQLEHENKGLQNKLLAPRICAEVSLCHLKDQIKKSLEKNSNFNARVYLELKNWLKQETDGACCTEVMQQFLSKLTLLLAECDSVIVDMEKKTNQIQESEILVKLLKEELRQEKAKAKEDAEDLTQEMAEFRYQISGMLEEECRRRARIEQTSLKWIQDLESQVKIEQEKSLATLERYQEAHELVQMQAREIIQLKKELERCRGC